MEYNKPEVKVLGSAIKAVQGQPKEVALQIDSFLQQTTNAYEADE